MLKSSGETTCRIACPTCQEKNDTKEDCHLTQEFLNDSKVHIVFNHTHCNHCGYSFDRLVVSGFNDVKVQPQYN